MNEVNSEIKFEVGHNVVFHNDVDNVVATASATYNEVISTTGSSDLAYYLAVRVARLLLNDPQ
jgi:hypothetical protein